MSRSTLIVLGAAALVIGLAAGAFLPPFIGSRSASSDASAIPGFLWPDPPTLEAFSLSDHEGKPFDRERLLGRWSMLYFGYTHCPDACPISLSVMREVDKLLETNEVLKDAFQPVFVSVDPARDTLEHLGQYVGHFGPRFIGVTGPEDTMPNAARVFGVVFTLTEPDDHGNYLVDHTSAFMLVDPQARLVAVLRPPHEAKSLAEDIARIERAVSG